ncbi:hypothetical protein FY557_04325 [Chryseobacterium sp. SN22]|uniref:hypothetical protein n=1 Tax=Chryseobacterium sp. SN22 TaxID=2606431 RepID=UPI0011EF982A|nr:hypothetical protein [Chryseobacterium sp. SN22]KAA0129533.1 hypothetical protein FY557_04325 [Chryseobacterium sp. SN22]
MDTEKLSAETPANTEKKERNRLYREAEFINKNCTRLEDFIINEEINAFDLRKLADLNGIDLQISEGWYPLTLELIRQLHENGWDKKVSCIKEKYAELRFYTADAYGSNLHTIIEKYTEKSQSICETCGAKGETRSGSGWEYVACRKHYLENRHTISAENLGFSYKGISYRWNEVKNMHFHSFDQFQGIYRFLIIEFHQKKSGHHGPNDDQLYVPEHSIRFGNFLQFLSLQPYDGPLYYSGLNRDYLNRFKHPEFCEICGYLAVYLDECECCENKTWKSYNKMIKGEDLHDREKKQEHIKLYQILWIRDEGEIYEQQQKNYPKNPEHRWLFTEEEYKAYPTED